MVDEIVEGYEELELDYPTGDGDSRLSQALKTTCLWRKELIKLPNSTACDHQVPPPSSSAPAHPISSLASSPAPTRPIDPPPPPPPSPAPARPINPPPSPPPSAC